jgi:cysteine desulfurase
MIYLDSHATTPPDPRVLAAMRPYWERCFANPASVEHALGREAEAAVEEARAAIAALIGAEPSEIVFTSGATESNNLAIKGAARFAAAQGTERRRIVTLATEHKCVLESVRDLRHEGFEPVVLPVDGQGLLDPAVLADALAVPTLLVSVMAVNNEIGVVQDLPAIAAAAKAAGALVHCDAAQAGGRIALDVRETPLDLVSLSAHKMYGPKGVGALYVRRRPRVRLLPLVGFGEAARLAAAEGRLDEGRAAQQRARFLARLSAAVPGLRENAARAPRIAANLSITFPGGADAQAIMAAAPGLCVSSGSACSSASVEPSYVLRAIGLPESEARATLRIGIGRFTSPRDIDTAADLLAEAWRRTVSGTVDQVSAE